MMEAKIYIPAGLGAKQSNVSLLSDVAGKPLITYTIDRALEADLPLAVVTDSSRINEVVIEHYGTDVELFFLSGSIDGHENGTSRIAEAVGYDDDFPEVVINWQANEPCVDPEEVRFISMKECDEIVSFVYESDDVSGKGSPNVVKVATDSKMNALYFSRCPIPHGTNRYFGHIGVYAYDREVLFELDCLRPTHVSERLEQLAWLANGHKIALQRIERPKWSVRTHQELNGFLEFVLP